ncbi:hypothetical protein B566_EDAN013380 [Ephemera danica]|nr:hypothetical protein B566_EDAN013380 [Ephemera danica]
MVEKTAARAVRRGDTVHLVPHKLSRDVGYELPSINKAFFTRKYRYYYATGMYDPNVFRNSVLKVNTETGEVLTWRENEFSFPGEAQFVARPGATDEDDGVLLCAVADVRRDHSDFLLVLDARSMTELARAQVTVHVPAALHGIFLH